MQSQSWPDEATVRILPFSRTEDGEDVIIGRMETSTFLAISPDALFLIDRLSDGATFGEAKRDYKVKYELDADAEEFLDLLQSKGFLTRTPPDQPAPFPTRPEPGPPLDESRWWLSRKMASRLASWPVITLMLCAMGAASILCLLDPGVIPRPRDAFFADHSSVKLLVVMAIIYLSTFVHELGHLVAGRKAGLPAKIGIGHRLWVLVLETDLTGLWAFPKSKRYLPILAGGLIDCTFVSLLLMAGFGVRKGVFAPDPAVFEMMRALTYLMLMRILWQFFLFVRTDVYFLIATFLGCRNLLGDTEAFLRNQVGRVLAWVKRTDQSGISARERRVIHSYAVVWLIGRALAIYALFFLTLPVLLLYLRSARTNILAGLAGDPYRLFDGLVIAVIYILPMTLGMVLWMRSLLKTWKGQLWKGKPWLARHRDGIEVP